MKQATSTLIATVVAVTLSGAAYAQNNTLATPTTKSPAAAQEPSGYGTPGTPNSDSGNGSSNSGQSNSANMSSTSSMPAYGVNNTLARPTTQSPAGQ